MEKRHRYGAMITIRQTYKQMQKKTAVEWLVEQVNADCLNSTFIRKELIDQAKSMEREQMENNWKDGMKSDNGHFGTFEQYYNETFKGGEQ